jgi:hypothetical protein
MDLELDGTGFGLGKRSQRYAAVIEDGVVSFLRCKYAFCFRFVCCAGYFLAACGQWWQGVAEGHVVLNLCLTTFALQVTKLEVESGPGLSCSAASNIISLL